jgi:hypothetical protein
VGVRGSASVGVGATPFGLSSQRPKTLGVDEDAGRRGPAIVGSEGCRDFVGFKQRMMIFETFVSFESHDTVRRAPRAGTSTGLPLIFPDLRDSLNAGIEGGPEKVQGTHTWKRGVR